MNTVILILVCAAAFIMTYIVTGYIRTHALKRQIIDIPNERSSHTAPTPRGGGLAIVLVSLLMSTCAALLLEQYQSLLLAVLIPGGMIAAVGYMDDRKEISIKSRLLVHFTAAGLAIYFLDFSISNYSFVSKKGIGVLLIGLAIVYLVWHLNLYNFMDGINGIAGIQAISVMLGGVLITQANDYDSQNIPVYLIFAAICLGFLLWNFPKARIFLGDVGSGFIGFIIGVFTVSSAQSSIELLIAWIILMGVFLVDSTVTLLRRLLHGDQIHQAHRCHAYQYASRKLESHTTVTIIVFLINILWLLPLSYAVSARLIDIFLGLFIAYLPLVIAAFWFKAGRSDLQKV